MHNAIVVEAGREEIGDQTHRSVERHNFIGGLGLQVDRAVAVCVAGALWRVQNGSVRHLDQRRVALLAPRAGLGGGWRKACRSGGQETVRAEIDCRGEVHDSIRHCDELDRRGSVGVRKLRRVVHLADGRVSSVRGLRDDEIDRLPVAGTAEERQRRLRIIRVQLSTADEDMGRAEVLAFVRKSGTRYHKSGNDGASKAYGDALYRSHSCDVVFHGVPCVSFSVSSYLSRAVACRSAFSLYVPLQHWEGLSPQTTRI